MSKANILVVEDESIVAADLQDRLKAMDYEVVGIAASGEDAVKKAVETHPDLALMDIVLKGEMDGVEAAERLRDDLNIPVVYLTAYTDSKTLERAKVTQPYGYIVKPFDERSIQASIEMALYRHKMENKVHSMERWLATAINSLTDGVIATDVKGLVTYLNPTAEMVLGYSMSEALGKPYQDVFKAYVGEERRPLQNLVKQTLADGLTFRLDEMIRMKSKDGTETTVDVSGAQVHDRKGVSSGIIIVFRDFEDRVKAEAELREMSKNFQERLEECTSSLNARSKEFDAFAYSVANDLKAPIRAIRNFSHMLQEEHIQQLEPDAVRLIEIIHRSARRMTGLLDQFLEMARMGRQPLQPVELDMGRLVETVIGEALPPSVRNQVELRIGELPGVTADKILMECAWRHLIGNAAKFSEFRGEPRIDISGRVDGDQACYSIKDNGRGFPMDYAEKIFTGFHKLHGDPDLEGAGVGLATVKRIVERHGGKIWAESEPDKGATFHFCLPVKALEKNGQTDD